MLKTYIIINCEYEITFSNKKYQYLSTNLKVTTKGIIIAYALQTPNIIYYIFVVTAIRQYMVAREGDDGNIKCKAIKKLSVKLKNLWGMLTFSRNTLFQKQAI